MFQSFRYSLLNAVSKTRSHLGHVQQFGSRIAPNASAHGHSHPRTVYVYAKNFFTRENIPPIALIVGCVALSFQVGVLYPWHEILSEDFLLLQEHTKSVQKVALELDKKLDVVVQLEKEVKAKERKVLDHEEEILKIQQDMLKIATALNSKMDRVIVLEEEVKVKERKVLDVENEILDTERVILKKLETIMKNNISLEQQTLH